MQYTYCSKPKGICLAETTLNSEKIKPITLPIIELCLSEDISQSGSQLGSQSVENFTKKSQNLVAICGSISGCTEGTLGLANQYCQGTMIIL